MKAVSYLSPNLFWFYRAIAAAIARSLDLTIEIEESKSDPLDDEKLHRDEWDLAFICGLPFARHRARSLNPLQAIAAPVMQGERYEDRPVYFADIIAAIDSPYCNLSDLQGKVFCYNDRGSNSGYNLLRQRLLELGYPPDFFARSIASGFHQRSIQWVARGLADCAAIDSVVLERELQDFPELKQKLRVIESIGPCPMPPIAISQRFDAATIEQIQNALFQPDAELKTTIAKAKVSRFAPVRSEDYDYLRVQYEAAVAAGYEFI